MNIPDKSTQPPKLRAQPTDVAVTKKVAAPAEPPFQTVRRRAPEAGGVRRSLQETEMPSPKNGFGHRVTSMISDWLALNRTELTWIALIGGGVLLVGLSMR